jgi:hypothetical protein
MPEVDGLISEMEDEARELFAALVASGGFATWAGASERVRRALVAGWVIQCSDYPFGRRSQETLIACRLYTLMASECPTEGGAS